MYYLKMMCMLCQMNRERNGLMYITAHCLVYAKVPKSDRQSISCGPCSRRNGLPDAYHICSGLQSKGFLIVLAQAYCHPLRT